MSNMKVLLFSIFFFSHGLIHGQDIEQTADSLMARHAGGGVLVIENGKTILKKAYGYADFESAIQANTSSNFRLASLTKHFIAMAILRLAEQEKLSLDDKLTSHFPEYPAYGIDISLEYLLQHLSGIPDYAALTPDSTSIQLSDHNALHLLLDEEEPDYKPGSKYVYSNSGYVLLGLIIEKASGQTLNSFLQKEFFEGLGITNTLMYERGLDLVPNRAFGHVESENGWEKNDQSLYSALRGDGGIYSSLDDMETWLKALDNGAVLRKESYAKMYTPPSIDGVETIYALGWRVGLFRGERLLSHGGSTRGFRHMLHRLPDGKTSVLILTNDNLEPSGYAEQILNRLGQ